MFYSALRFCIRVALVFSTVITLNILHGWLDLAARQLLSLLLILPFSGKTPSLFPIKWNQLFLSLSFFFLLLSYSFDIAQRIYLLVALCITINYPA